MSDLNKIINEQRERIAQLEKENALLLIKTLPECNCEGLQERISELEKLLVEVTNGATGQAPCAKYCEARATEIEMRNLKKRLADVERERDESDDDLKYTQKQCSEAESKLESLSLLFCDADGNPFFEPFDAGNLSLWLNRFAIEQQIKALEEALHTVANQYNGTDSTEWSNGANHVLRLFVKHTSRLRQQLNGGE